MKTLYVVYSNLEIESSDMQSVGYYGEQAVKIDPYLIFQKIKGIYKNKETAEKIIEEDSMLPRKDKHDYYLVEIETDLI